MARSPQVTLGVIQFGDDRNLTPVVCLDCPDLQSAQELATFLLKVQNGARTMAYQDHAFTAGDLAIKVVIDRHPQKPKDAVLASVSVRLDERHLTEAFYAASTVEADPAKLFRFMNHAFRNFVVTVAIEGQPCTDLVYLVKYILEWKSPVESAPP
jgi:hypothetical protein